MPLYSGVERLLVLLHDGQSFGGQGLIAIFITLLRELVLTILPAGSHLHLFNIGHSILDTYTNV
eukprot:1409997-Ditylum_brightwellii.AAC.1